MYTRCCSEEDVQRKDKLGLLQYRLNLAKAMMKYDGGRVDPNFLLPGSRSRLSSSPSVSSNLNPTGDECMGRERTAGKKTRTCRATTTT